MPVTTAKLTAAVEEYLNDRAYWRNVPSAVWSYKLGGYQVLKKWLSYRERCGRRKCSTSRTPQGASLGYWGW